MLPNSIPKIAPATQNATTDSTISPRKDKSPPITDKENYKIVVEDSRLNEIGECEVSFIYHVLIDDSENLSLVYMANSLVSLEFS